MGTERCPTCGHCVTVLGCKVYDRPFWLCQLCGTHRTCDGDGNGPITVVPDLVRRVLEFGKTLTGVGPFGVPETLARWNELGLSAIKEI